MSKVIFFHFCEECKRGISYRHSQESEKSVGVNLCRSCWTMSDEYIGPDCFLLDLDCFVDDIIPSIRLDTQGLFSFSGEIIGDQLLDCCRQVREELQRLKGDFTDVFRVIQNIEYELKC